jgi:hypothetical protein
MVMTIGGPGDFGCGHRWPNTAEYAGQRHVKHLMAELVEFLVIGMLFVRWKELA